MTEYIEQDDCIQTTFNNFPNFERTCEVVIPKMYVHLMGVDLRTVDPGRMVYIQIHMPPIIQPTNESNLLHTLNGS